MSETTKPEATRAPSNVIFVGKKSALVYAVAALMQINNSSEVMIRARGRAISKAVDVVEILKGRFLQEALKIKDIKIGTELLPPKQEGLKPRNVSTIEITVTKS
ncbi:MAG: DNA/RNA-binding protein AlbA [Thermoproteota archaeon]|jgi:DNA-binding protein